MRKILLTSTLLLIFLVLLIPELCYADYYDKNSEALISADAEKFKEDRLYFYFTDARVQVKKDGTYIEVAGESNLPDGVIIHLFLKRYDHTIGSAATELKGYRFSYTLGPFEKEFYPGIYNLEATIVSYLQADELMSNIPQGWIDRQVTIYREVQFGSVKQIVEIQEIDIAQIKVVADELKVLYEELVQQYQEAKTRYNRLRWLNWSKNWRIRMDELKEKNAKRNQGKVIGLFPDTEERLRMTIRLVDDLQTMMYYKFEGNDPRAIAFITIKEAIKITPAIIKEIKQSLIMDFIPEFGNSKNIENAVKEEEEKRGHEIEEHKD